MLVGVARGVRISRSRGPRDPLRVTESGHMSQVLGRLEGLKVCQNSRSGRVLQFGRLSARYGL